MSLYRKYRPQSFDDVVSQTAVVETLKQAVAQGKLSHAYLFAGARGTGKTSLARILAKHILTKDVEDATLKKQLIHAVEEGSLVDLIEIDAASNRGIDDIRDLIEKIQFAPVVASAKVYIIDEVHMLTREAFNALLKTLEEPPSYAYFILATTEMHKIPATIQSRCQKYVFRHIKEDDIVGRLRHVADEEKMTIDDEALTTIAHHAQGGLRDALSLLDQLRSLKKISAADVRERTGASAREYGEAIIKALQNNDRAAIIQSIHAAEESGMTMDVLARDLLSRTREALHAAIGRNEPVTSFVHTLDALLEATKSLRVAPLPGLALESALLSLIQTSHVVREPVATPVAVQKVPEPVTPVVEKPVIVEKTVEEPVVEPERVVPVAIPGTVAIQQVWDVWPSVVENIKPASAKMSLKNGKVTLLQGDTLTIAFETQFHKDRVAKEATLGIEQMLQEKLGLHIKVRCVMDEHFVASPPVRAEETIDLAEAAADVF